jgi:hypothetical protein
MASDDLVRELVTVQALLANESPTGRQEWHNAYNAYYDELERLRQQLPADFRDAVKYVAQREIALTLRAFLDQLRSEAPTLKLSLSGHRRAK